MCVCGCTMACGIFSFPNQELNPCPLQWKPRILTTGRPGKSQLYGYSLCHSCNFCIGLKWINPFFKKIIHMLSCTSHITAEAWCQRAKMGLKKRDTCASDMQSLGGAVLRLWDTGNIEAFQHSCCSKHWRQFMWGNWLHYIIIMPCFWPQTALST